MQTIIGTVLQPFATRGESIWLGLRSPDGVHDAPVIIPVNHIAKETSLGAHSYGTSSLHYHHEHYINIRIILREALVKAQQEFAAHQDKRPIAPLFKQEVGKVGRPSVKAYLVEAFDALTQAGEINLARSFRSHSPKVRAWLVTAYPDDSARLNNIADETIRRALAPLFYEMRKNTKQIK